jgi:hypothetical protein
MMPGPGSTKLGWRFRRTGALVAIAITGFTLGSCARANDSDARPAAATTPTVSGLGDTRIPYRPGGGRFCEVSAEGTSIRPDVVNRLVFLEAGDAQRLVTELRARDRVFVTAAPVELQSDVGAIAQAAARLYDGLEANGFDLQGVPNEVLGSLSARDLRPAFERTNAYLQAQCDIDIHAILSTV